MRLPAGIDQGLLPGSPEAMPLYRFRAGRGLTQQQLAQRLGMTQSAVGQIEHGTDWLVSTLRNFFEALGGQVKIYAVFPASENVRSARALAGKLSPSAAGREPADPAAGDNSHFIDALEFLLKERVRLGDGSGRRGAAECLRKLAAERENMKPPKSAVENSHIQDSVEFLLEERLRLGTPSGRQGAGEHLEKIHGQREGQ